MKNSYGAKLDLGYDIANNFAAFAAVGYDELRSQYEDNGVVNVDYSEELSDTSEAIMYDAGIQYSLNDQVDLNLAYEYVDYKGSAPSDLNTGVIRAGVSFKF